MVTGRLGSGSTRNGSFVPRYLSLCHQALATLAAGKIRVSAHSISLLASLTFWFLLGVPHFLCQWCGAFWNVLGSQGRLCLLMGSGMKGVHTL